jgi:tetratricopeptide (TPR) repeat protein
VVEGLKPHTILFATGDEADITTLYITAVARVRPDVTVVLSPIFELPWYAQVLRHNRQINVPATKTTLNIIGANPGRPVAFIGNAPDKSINGLYYLYPDGLVNDLEPEATNISLTQEETDNMAQLSRIHVPSYRAIKPDSFEQTILDQYADVAYQIGQAYKRAGQKAGAIVWYRKALSIDPTFSLASNAISKLGATA